jgi:hypothetical protein
MGDQTGGLPAYSIGPQQMLLPHNTQYMYLGLLRYVMQVSGSWICFQFPTRYVMFAISGDGQTPETQ